MPVLRPSSTGRFRPEALFRPQSLAVFGASSATGAEVMGNLLRGGFGGSVLPVCPTGRAVSGVLAYPDVDSLPLAPDLAVFADAAPTGSELHALVARDCFAAVCLRSAPDQAARDGVPGMRVLGPHAFGLCVPGIGLNASTAHLQPRAGRVAFVSQSAALCRAVLDWAEPNGVGFSHVVGLGVGVSTSLTMTLDWLARDPGTGAILLDVRTVRDRRAFLSAARAAARLRPVVAIRAGGRLLDPSGFGDQVFDAALRRAGVVRVNRLFELLAAAEILTRAKPAASERLAIVTNAVAPGQMAADAAIAAGLQLPEPPAGEDALAGPPQPVSVAAAEADPRQGHLSEGIVWTGTASPARIADAAISAAGLPGVGGVLTILSPQRDLAAAVAGMAGLPAKVRVPLLACALGETTGAAHRHSLAEAGVPAFATPESAVRGFEHLVMNRRARAAAQELPSSAVLEMHPDRERVCRVLAEAQASGEGVVADGMVAEVVAAYGFAYHGDRAPTSPAQVHVRVVDDPVFGPAIGVAADARSRAQDTAWDLPPLNLTLASALVARADAAGALVRLSDADKRDLADALVRISQLVVDTPRLGSLDAVLCLGDGGAVCYAVLKLRAPGAASRLAIAPYPEEWVERFEAGSEVLTIRPIRPEDAEAHTALFRRLTPEDVRYRFFSALRDLPPEQIARMTQVDYDREVAFVAVRDQPGPQRGQTVGVARLVREGYADGRDAWGEFAVVVQSDMKGKGVGRRLMQRLEDWGRAHGMAGIEGQILAENAPMLAFIRRLGYEVRRMADEPDVVEARRPLR